MKVVYGEGWYNHGLLLVLLRKTDKFLKGVMYYAYLVGEFSCPLGSPQVCRDLFVISSVDD
jgi:hypothetical protein